MWTVPAGFTNTGLCVGHSGHLSIADYDSGRIVFADLMGAEQGNPITLAGHPPSTLQGIAWDAGRSCYWAASSSSGGTIRRYSLSGELQQTVSSGRVPVGPNGLCYDASSDVLLALFDDAVMATYSASTGSLASSVTLDASLGSGSGSGPDGITLDPVDPASFVWIAADAPAQRVAKVNRATGAVVSNWPCVQNAEGLVWVDGSLYLCSDQGYHAAVAGGNRVYRYTAGGEPDARHTVKRSLFGVYK